MEQQTLNPTSAPFRAHMLAIAIHTGQFDKSGRPYMDHVERVVGLALQEWKRSGSRESGLHVAAAAWLHDVVEDYPGDGREYITGLIQDLFGFEVSVAVNALTHRPGEPRWNYIQRVHGNSIATPVKIADLKEHLQAPGGFEGHESMMRRYRRELEYFGADAA